MNVKLSKFRLALVTATVIIFIITPLQKSFTQSTFEPLNFIPNTFPTSRNPALWPFSADSPWNMPLAMEPSITFIRDVNDPGVRDLIDPSLYTDIAATQWSHPIYVATSSDPMTSIYRGSSLQITTPIPSNATPAQPPWPNTDAHLHIIDPTNHYVDEMWQARPRSGGGWLASGYTRNDLYGPGIGAGGERAYGGSAIAGLIRRGELANGIYHALTFAIDRSHQKCCSPVWPATYVDAGAPGTYLGNIPMGQLVAIPPEININSYGFSPQGLAIARALQDYGAYDVDSGGDFSFYVEPAAVGEIGNAYNDVATIRSLLRFVSNNRADNVGGGSPSAPRRAPLAPPFSTAGGSVPVAPSNLIATPTSTSQINLSWFDNSSDETNFKIERKTGSTGTYSQISTTGANITSFSNTGLTSGTTYFYRIRATNSAGDSAYSNEVSATTSSISVPTAPSTLTATAVSSSQINIAWRDNSSNETGFTVERKTTASGTYAQIAVVNSNVITYSNTGLSAGTTYFYRVKATNSAGSSSYSNEASATTSISVPSAPSTLTATTASSSQINIAWRDNSSNETGFTVERKTTASGTYAQIAVVNANVITYSNTGLSAGITYFYRVKATNSAGSSSYSNEASATTSVSIPSAPSTLTATAVSSSQINIAWRDNSSNETGFTVERKTTASGTYAQIAVVNANVIIYANTGLSAGTTYFYRVKATNSAGSSSYSNEASATTSQTLSPELLTNSGLDQGSPTPTGWTFFTWDGPITFSLDTAVKHSGNQSVRIDSTSNTKGGSVSQIGLAISPGVVYDLSSWIQTTSGSGWIAMQIDWYTNTGAFISTSEVGGITSAISWTQISGTATAPTQAASASVNIYSYFPGKTWIDDASLKRH